MFLLFLICGKQRTALTSIYLWSWHCGCTWAAVCRWWCPSWSRGRLFQDTDLCACCAEREPWRKRRRSQTEPCPLVRRMNLCRSAHGLKRTKEKKKNATTQITTQEVKPSMGLLLIDTAINMTVSVFLIYAPMQWSGPCSNGSQSRLKYMNDTIFKTEKLLYNQSNM